MSAVPASPSTRSLRGRTFVARWTERYGVFVHGDTAPPAEDWSLILGMWREIPDPRSFRVLVFSRGAAPDAVQRAELNKVLGGARPRVALLTTSLIPRIAGKAFALFIPDFRVFDERQLDLALNYLDLGSDRARAERTLSDLREEVLGPPSR
jgi:hypothetical protein